MVNNSNLQTKHNDNQSNNTIEVLKIMRIANSQQKMQLKIMDSKKCYSCQLQRFKPCEEGESGKRYNGESVEVKEEGIAEVKGDSNIRDKSESQSDSSVVSKRRRKKAKSKRREMEVGVKDRGSRC
ncbi:conserved hypothetical protein [Ricinus communis]|uniref:Uncharacterized protein n=1 Tax=Ricinus communis TaxID=3988 RepID=B9RU28_RICCO|nr:conserved hypothetical protein [Ricinus communis]